MLQQYRNEMYSSDVYSPPASTVLGKMPDLYLALMGRFYTSGHFVYQQVPQRCVLHVVSSGEGIMRVNGTSYTVGRGDAFCFFPGQHYHYWDRPLTPWRYTWFSLEGPMAIDALTAAGITIESPCVRTDVATLLEPIFAEVEIIYGNDDIMPTFPVAAAWRLIDAIARQRHSPAVVMTPDIAEAAKTMMDDHLTLTLSIEEIAERLGISRSTLFRKFRQRYQVTPKDYFDAVRIDHAERLLRHSRSGIKEIAAACGFQDSHYFSRAFRKHRGYPPSAVRKAGE